MLRTVIYFALYSTLKNWECCAIFRFLTYKRIPIIDCSITKGPLCCGCPTKGWSGLLRPSSQWVMCAMLWVRGSHACHRRGVFKGALVSRRSSCIPSNRQGMISLAGKLRNMLTLFLSLVIITLDELLKSENICPKIPQQLLFMLSSPADWTTAMHFCTAFQNIWFSGYKQSKIVLPTLFRASRSMHVLHQSSGNCTGCQWKVVSFLKFYY